MQGARPPARVQLLETLSTHGACYFGSLADVLPLSPSTIFQHVSVLKQVGMILGSADALRVGYCVNTERLALLKQIIGSPTFSCTNLLFASTDGESPY